jgi:hypothetical protein
MKLYLAGPMRGLPEHNTPAFHDAARRLRAAGHRVFDPADLHFAWDELGGRLAMQAELSWICREGEAVALLDGWERSLGATAEIATARALGLPVYLLGELVGPPERHSFR